jgi:hypothetical protein
MHNCTGLACCRSLLQYAWLQRNSQNTAVAACISLCSLMAGLRSELRPAATLQELITKITEVLKESPPLKPSNAAVDLLLAVGRLQVLPCTWTHMQLLAEASG